MRMSNILLYTAAPYQRMKLGLFQIYATNTGISFISTHKIHEGGLFYCENGIFLLKKNLNNELIEKMKYGRATGNS